MSATRWPASCHNRFEISCPLSPSWTRLRGAESSQALPEAFAARAAETSRSAAVDAAGQPILEVRGLSRRFGGIVAVDRLSFAVQAGTIHGLIGPNGAGKTTTFNVISGYYAP